MRNLIVTALALLVVQGEVLGQAGSWILPSSAFRAGANGAEFHSDVRLLNPGGTQVTVTSSFYDQETGQTFAASPFQIAPRSQTSYDNILQTLFGRTLAQGAYGPIRFQATTPIVVSSSVNNVNACGTGATSGQWLPGLSVSQGTRAGIIGQLAVSRSAATGYRTNVVFVNPGSAAATVNAIVRRGGGSQLSSGTVGPIAANGFSQIPLDSASVFPEVAGTTDTNLWMDFTSDQPVMAFASVINNASGDPFAVVATPTIGAGTGCSATPCSGCLDSELSAGIERLATLRSTDGGKTWTDLGHACFHAPALTPVDPSAINIDGGTAIYFLDINTLAPGTPARKIYRAITTNGLSFTQPTLAFTTPRMVTDPFVLRLANGSYVMYMHEETGLGITTSSDGVTFPSSLSIIPGALPGALQLPDGSVRLFDCGPNGIVSRTSPNGTTGFTDDPGIRIPGAPGGLVCDPNPIPLRAGGYLMVYKWRPPGAPVQEDQVFAATSTDSLTWVSGSAPVAIGSVPTVIELADGTLLLYFVDFNY